jgi:hypothetical protein
VALPPSALIAVGAGAARTGRGPMTGSIQPYPTFGASCKGGIEKDGIEINRMAPQPP